MFLDFKKAFDSVHRNKMLKILKAYCIPKNILRAITVMYNTMAKILTPDGETDYITILAGVLQGDRLAPFLFAIVLDYVLRKSISGYEEKLGFHIERRRSRRVNPVVIIDLDFADDIAGLVKKLKMHKSSPLG